MLKFVLTIIVLASIALVQSTPINNKIESASSNQVIPKIINAEAPKPVCQLCTVVLTTAQTLLEQNRTEEQIIQFLEQQLCGKLGGLKDICDQYINANGKLIIYELAQKIDPSIICGRIGLCVSATKNENEEKKPTKDATCDLCIVIFTQIVGELEQNKTEQEIIQTIEDKLCTPLGQLSSLCKLVINQYGPVLIEKLASGVEPSKICSFVGLCPKKNLDIMDIGKMLVSKRSFPSNPNTCPVCTAAFQAIESLIEEEKNVDEIINSMELVCQLLPEQTRSDCVSLIRTYGKSIIEYLLQAGNPKAVCTLLKLCP